jgi:hypothetical protein
MDDFFPDQVDIGDYTYYLVYKGGIGRQKTNPNQRVWGVDEPEFTLQEYTKIVRQEIADEIEDFLMKGYQGAESSNSAFTLMVGEYIKNALLHAASIARKNDNV